MLPAESVLIEICRYFKQLDSNSASQLEHVVHGVEAKPKKLLVYKFFFFNYLLQVTFSDLKEPLQKNQSDLRSLISSLHMMLGVFRNRKVNLEFDVALRPYKYSSNNPTGTNQTDLPSGN